MKKKAQKEFEDIKVNESVDRTMTESEMEKWSKMLREIGTDKQPGLVMILEINENKLKGEVRSSGAVFAHGASRRAIIQTLIGTIRQMGLSPFELAIESL